MNPFVKLKVYSDDIQHPTGIYCMSVCAMVDTIEKRQKL